MYDNQQSICLVHVKSKKMAEREIETEISQPETRVRKENVSPDDEDGVKAEKINRLRRSRGGFLSSVTSKRNEIDRLLLDP